MVEQLVLEPRSTYDRAILGVMYRCAQQPLLVYSYEKLVAALVEEGWESDDALEHVEVNILGAWVGEGTPGVVIALEPEDAYRELEGW